MDIRTLQNTVIDALEDLKAQEVKAFSTTGLTDLFDRVILATGTSNRHTKALAASVRDKVKTRGGHIISVEGEETGEWVLVDLGDVVVHIMQPAIRNYYNLEELWGAKPVLLRLASSRGAAKTGHAPGKKGASRKSPTVKPRPAAPRKSATKSAAKSAAKPTSPGAGAAKRRSALKKTEAR